MENAKAISTTLPLEISSFRYSRCMENITLLRVMGEIDNKEVRRLIGMIKSQDMENWTVAEGILKEKLL